MAIGEQEALSLLEQSATNQGLTVIRSDMEYDDLGLGAANIYVAMDDAEQVYSRMRALERAVNTTWGGECRTGFYSAAIGYDVPGGLAQIQIDLLPFDLDPPAPSRRS